MVSIETIKNKLEKLPPSSRKQVLDYIDSLLAKPSEFNREERIAAIKEWAQSHANNRAVLVDDSREGLYED